MSYLEIIPNDTTLENELNQILPNWKDKISNDTRIGKFILLYTTKIKKDPYCISDNEMKYFYSILCGYTGNQNFNIFLDRSLIVELCQNSTGNLLVNKLPFGLQTYNLYKDIDLGFLSKEDLLKESKYRNYPENIQMWQIAMCLMNTMPTFKWMIDNSRLSIKDENNLFMKYRNYGYLDMNESLRINSYASAKLNLLIENMIPLEKKILVFRYTGYKIEDDHITTGYLSTSLSANLVFKGVERGNLNRIIWKIIVPVGAKCLSSPTYHEYELLFAHGTKLKFIKKEILYGLTFITWEMLI